MSLYHIAAAWALVVALFRWHVVSYNETCVMFLLNAPAATMYPGELWWRWSPAHSVGHCVGHPVERFEVGPLECACGNDRCAIDSVNVATPIANAADLVRNVPQWRAELRAAVFRSTRLWCNSYASAYWIGDAALQLEGHLNKTVLHAFNPGAFATVGAILKIPDTALARRATELAMITALGPEYYIRLLAANNTALQVYTPGR